MAVDHCIFDEVWRNQAYRFQGHPRSTPPYSIKCSTGTNPSEDSHPSLILTATTWWDIREQTNLQQCQWKLGNSVDSEYVDGSVLVSRRSASWMFRMETDYSCSQQRGRNMFPNYRENWRHRFDRPCRCFNAQREGLITYSTTRCSEWRTNNGADMRSRYSIVLILWVLKECPRWAPG